MKEFLKKKKAVLLLHVDNLVQQSQPTSGPTVATHQSTAALVSPKGFQQQNTLGGMNSETEPMWYVFIPWGLTHSVLPQEMVSGQQLPFSVKRNSCRS